MSAAGLAVALAVLLVLAGIVVLLSSVAGRLDRLHIRLATAQASLDRQLVDRAAATAAVGHAGVLDPAASVVLLAAAEHARSAPPVDRAAAESALSVDLRAVFRDAEAVEGWVAHPDAGPLLVELAASCDRVRLAHRFHDDLVVRTLAVRSRWLVRTAHLAGHAPRPALVELDDAAPEALTAATARGTAGLA